MKGVAASLFFLGMTASLFAAVDQEVRSFGARIAQAAGPGPVFFQYAGTTGPREALARELAARGLPAAQAIGSRRCRITFSASLTRQVWTADLQIDQDRRLVVHEFSAEAPAGSPPASSKVVLERMLLFEDAHPILDVLDGPERLVVLQPSRLLIRTATATEPMNLTLSRPAPRDPRGRLIATPAGFKALLFNGTCESIPGLYCRDEVEPWPLDGVDAQPVRGANYFENGFYSVAQLAGTQYFARRDSPGRAWGDDLAAIDTPCGRWLLASSPRPREENDSLRAYQPPSAQPASEPLDLPGPVTALWPSGPAAIAVSRNRTSGTYAAYRVTARCLP